jgi:hypothetical protein
MVTEVATLPEKEGCQKYAVPRVKVSVKQLAAAPVTSGWLVKNTP